MSQAGDALTRRHARDVMRRVDTIKRDVKRAVHAAGLPARGDVDALAAQLTQPLLAASWAGVRDQLRYAQEYAAVEEAPPPSVPPPLGPSDETKESIAGLAVVMREVMRRGRNKPNSAVRKVLGVVVGGQASRVAMHDAREWVQRYLATDPSIRAYRRVPDDDPCYFCAMLASRGFVYRTRRSAGDVRVVQGWHPACACTTQAAFVGRATPSLDPVTTEAQRIYDSSTGSYHGKDKARAFRRAWENRRHT